MSGAHTRVDAAALHALARDGTLSPRAYARAREIAGIAPDRARWRAFLDRVLAIGAALLLATAAVFLVAYNWAALDRFTKLAGIEAALVAMVAFALWRGARSWRGRAALFVATALAGALLAFVGQTYQTGADTWQLFAAWALLALPWALAAGWSPLWALVLALANVALLLWLSVAPSLFAWIDAGEGVPVALTAMNAAAALLAEWIGPRDDAPVHRLLPRFAVIVAVVAATGGMLRYIFMPPDNGSDLLLNYIVTLVLVVAAYRALRLDLMLLSLAALSAIVVAASAVGHGTLGMLREMGLLLIAVTVIAMSAGAAHWIRVLARRERR